MVFSASILESRKGPIFKGTTFWNILHEKIRDVEILCSIFRGTGT